METRGRTTISLPVQVLADLRSKAAQEKTSVSSLLERYALEGLRMSNPVTMAAIADAKAHRGLKRVDMTSFDTFVKSMEE